MTEVHSDPMSAQTAVPTQPAAAPEPPRPLTVKQAIAWGGLSVGSIVAAAWSWADNVTAELATIKTQVAVSAALVERVSRLEVSEARTDSFKSEILRRLDRIDEKLDRLADRK